MRTGDLAQPSGALYPRRMRQLSIGEWALRDVWWLLLPSGIFPLSFWHFSIALKCISYSMQLYLADAYG